MTDLCEHKWEILEVMFALALIQGQDQVARGATNIVVARRVCLKCGEQARMQLGNTEDLHKLALDMLHTRAVETKSSWFTTRGKIGWQNFEGE